MPPSLPAQVVKLELPMDGNGTGGARKRGAGCSDW